jgi:lysophospholipase L1-like esterase
VNLLIEVFVVQNNENIFEKHPKKTLGLIILLILAAFYGLCSIKFINNQYTEFENKNIKTILHQYYVGKIIDNNVGRFIKLREHRPNQEKFERPTRNYIKNLEPNSLERKYYKVATDKHGFIGPSEIHDNPDYKIVFLGGSTTECLYMDEHHRFPYLVGRQLEKTLNKKVNSYNGGVSANESMHSLNILMNKVLPLQPNIVVLMHNINDLVILRSQTTYWYTDSLKSHVQTAKNIFTRHEFPSNQKIYDELKISEEFRRNLQTFIAICRIRDIQPVLMTQANRVKDDKLYHRFNDIIREVGEKEGVLVVDLANNIPATSDYFYDSYHYTASGAQLAADVISKELEKRLIDSKAAA